MRALEALSSTARGAAAVAAHASAAGTLLSLLAPPAEPSGVSRVNADDVAAVAARTLRNAVRYHGARGGAKDVARAPSPFRAWCVLFSHWSPYDRVGVVNADP
jgi:hypothetical protein